MAVIPRLCYYTNLRAGRMLSAAGFRKTRHTSFVRRMSARVYVKRDPKEQEKMQRKFQQIFVSATAGAVFQIALMWGVFHRMYYEEPMTADELHQALTKHLELNNNKFPSVIKEEERHLSLHVFYKRFWSKLTPEERKKLESLPGSRRRSSSSSRGGGGSGLLHEG